MLWNWFAVKRSSTQATVDRSQPETGAEIELGALASIYRRAIARYLETKAAGEVGGEDYARKESKHVSRDSSIPT